MDKYELRKKIRDIVDSNCDEIEWEGTTVNRDGIVDGVIEYFNGEVKVYEFRWESMGYGRGVMLVAALNKDEAIECAQDEDNHWVYDNESNLLYTGKSDLPCVILESHYQE